MGSVQFQIVPCSSLYFFLRSVGPFQCLVNANYRFLICCTCHFQSDSFFFVYFGFLCKSLQCLISALTKGAKVVTYSGSLVQLCCGEEGTLQTNITGVCGEFLQCLGYTGFAPTHGAYAFPVYTSQALGCSAGELSEAGPGLRALPRSKPLSFRISGTPRSHRLSWACVLCPSQV